MSLHKNDSAAWKAVRTTGHKMPVILTEKAIVDLTAKYV
jgi:hypothetical protein